MSEALTALQDVFTDPMTLVWVIIGTTLGITVGAIPGLTGAMLIALTLPLTHSMQPEAHMVLLVSMYVGSISGGLIGWTLGHGLVALASPIVEAKTGVVVGFFDLAPALPPYLPVSPELLLVPLLAILAIAVGLIPAISAYRTDVSESLGK